MELQNRLVALRKEKGLSQEELAEKLYVSRQTISNWERGHTYPDINSLLLIATFFDVSLDNLIKGDVDIMKHQVKQTQLKRWLIIAAAIVFIWNFLAPIGRFYPIPNFKLRELYTSLHQPQDIVFAGLSKKDDFRFRKSSFLLLQ